MKPWTGRPHLSILGAKEEDRFTHYLCELLRAPSVLAAFLKDLCNVEVKPNVNVSMQPQVTEGRPDLAIRGESTYLLFEAKVGSWLHEDQLSPYARELDQWLRKNPAGTARLFVVAPHRQVLGIAHTAKQELSEAGLSHFQPVGIAWEQIATLFQTLDANDPRLNLHLREFSEIILYRLGEPTRPFTVEECKLLDDPLVARSLHRARLLIEHVKQILSNQGFSFKDSRGFLYDGYGVAFEGRTWWYGIWIDAWAKLGLSPIFLQLLGLTNRVVPLIPEGLPSPVSVQFGKLEEQVVPLPIRDAVELESLAREQANIILRYTTELPESGAG